jgi:ferredoxin-NADP reductase
MATARTATVIAAHPVGPGARVLELELPAGDPLGFRGGQYIIVNSGVTLASGKLAKRAYSLVSADAEQRRVHVAVKRLPGGPGSGFMHGLEVGAQVEFSGPWGSFVAPDAPPDGPAMILATDTGITAAFGLVRGGAFAARRAQTQLVWATDHLDDFVPGAWLGELGLPARQVLLGSDRVAAALDLVLRTHAATPLADAWLCGDGKLVHPVRDALCAAGLPAERVRVECFFNNPSKKSL